MFVEINYLLYIIAKCVLFFLFAMLIYTLESLLLFFLFVLLVLSLSLSLLLFFALFLLTLLTVVDQLYGCLARLGHNEVGIKQEVLDTLLVVKVHTQAYEDLVADNRCLIWIFHASKEIRHCRQKYLFHLSYDKSHLMLKKI